MAATRSAAESRRITLVADELRGLGGGGIASATAFLAIALGRRGHAVEVLYVGPGGTDDMEPEWARSYEEANVRIRALPRTERVAEPSYFARMRDVDQALATQPPDVVVTQDLAAPAYTALRMRHLGLAFEQTLFVVYCHGSRQWITDMARKVRVLPGAMGIGVLERASVDLADVVVSPSAYMRDWMRREGWRLPDDARVIPLLTRSAATGEPALPRAEVAAGPARVRRIAFFGRLEERKGIRPFAAGLNALEPELLHGVELEFVGPATAAWPRERVEALLAESTRRALRRIAFETALDQPDALVRLCRSGTVAVMPSLEDNSPATVYECLERGIPFLASDAGGTSELVAEVDRDRVLFEPTPDGVAAALRSVLAPGQALHAAQPAFAADAAVEQWLDVVAMSPPPGAVPSGASATVESLTVVGSDRAGVTADWVLLFGADDVADDGLVEVLVRAQQATGADVVTCGLRVETAGRTFEQYFPGDPGALGLLENGYGTVALIRGSSIPAAVGNEAWAGDPAWPLLARLVLSGATIVSVPQPLARRSAPPGDLRGDPAAALAVAEAMEAGAPAQLRLLPRLGGALAAAAASSPRAPGSERRLRDRLAALVAR
jgi:glycosyltransferase involved in cell wall biosynthesis